MTEARYSEVFTKYWPTLLHYCFQLCNKDQVKADQLALQVIHRLNEVDMSEAEIEDFLINAAYLASKSKTKYGIEERRNMWILACTVAEIHEAINQSPEEDRQILKLHVIDKKEPALIARELQILPIMVKRRIERFNERISKQYKYDL